MFEQYAVLAILPFPTMRFCVMYRAMDMQAPPPVADTPIDARPVWPGWLIATAQCIRFYSRLPMPAMPGENDPHAVPDFRLMPRALPFAALIILLPAALTALVTSAAGMPAILGAALVLAVQVLSTGAFHEDGLADSFDGLFGGHTKDRRLDIMKDSRVGTFGACALILSLMLRGSALSILLEELGGTACAAGLLAAAGWSRAEGIRLLAREAPARAYGAAAAVGQPQLSTAYMALGLAALIGAFISLIGGLAVEGYILGLVVSTLLTMLLAFIARRLIGGPTGDIAGAAQQLAEIAILSSLVCFIS
jgi:adenosylcobinamide-GDP ribazoletransferase